MRVPVEGVKGKVAVKISGGMLLQWTVSPGTHLASRVAISRCFEDAAKENSAALGSPAICSD